MVQGERRIQMPWRMVLWFVVVGCVFQRMHATGDWDGSADDVLRVKSARTTEEEEEEGERVHREDDSFVQHFSLHGVSQEHRPRRTRQRLSKRKVGSSLSHLLHAHNTSSITTDIMSNRVESCKQSLSSYINVNSSSEVWMTQLWQNVDNGRPLPCWLWNLVVDIPDQSFKQGLITVKTLDMRCTHFEIGSLSSTYLPPTNTTTGGIISLTLSQIAATCHGTYHASAASGTLQATVSNSTLHLAVHVIPDPTNHHWTAQSVVVSSCDAQLVVPKDQLQFSGSLSARIVNLFSGRIANYVTKTLSNETCPALEDGMNSVLHEILTQVNGFVEDLVHRAAPSPDPAPPIDPEGNQPMMLLEWSQDVPLLQTLLTTLNYFLLQEVTLQGNCGLSGMIAMLTNNTMKFQLEVPPSLQPHLSWNVSVESYGTVVLDVTHVNVTGLEGLTTLQIAQPVEARALHTALAASSSSSSSSEEPQGMNVSLGLDLKVFPTDTIHGHVLHETFHLEMDIQDVNLTSRLYLGVDKTQWKQLGASPTPSSFLLFCFRQVLKQINTTDVSAQVQVQSLGLSMPDKHQRNEVELEDALDELINHVFALVVEEYGRLLSDVTYAAVQGPLRGRLNDMLVGMLLLPEKEEEEEEHGGGGSSLVSFMRSLNEEVFMTAVDSAPFKSARLAINPQCKPTPKNSTFTTELFQFDTNPTIQSIHELLKSKNGLENINEWIQCTVDSWKDAGVLNGTVFHYEDGCGLNVTVGNVILSHLDRVDALDVVRSEIDHYHIMNSVSYGQCPTPDTNKLNQTASCDKVPRAQVTMDLQHQPIGLHLQLNTSLTLHNISFQSGMDILYNLATLRSMHLYELLSGPSILPCFFMPSSSLQLYDVWGSLGKESTLTVDAAMQMKDWEEPQYGTLSFHAASVNAVLQQVLSIVERTVNGLGDLAVEEAHYKCRPQEVPPPPLPPTDDENGGGEASSSSSSASWNEEQFWETPGFFWVLGVSCVLAVVLLIRQRRGELEEEMEATQAMQSLDGVNDASVPLLSGDEDGYESANASPQEETPLSELENDKIEEKINQEELGLMFSPHTPNLIRYVIPVALLCTITLFVSSNLSVGASVDPVVSREDDGTSFHLPPTFSFSLANTVEEMYNAGVYALMILIVLLSGIWPYVKLMLMLLSWVAPESVLSLPRREQLLIWLDALGKYSLVDIYVLVLMMVAFRFHLDLSGYALDVYVTPMYGFYSFLMATVTSLILGHVILFLHRKLTATEAIVQEGATRESIRCHRYAKREDQGRIWVLNKRFQIAVVAILLVALILLVIGVQLESFRFEMKGLAGMLLQERKVKTYSFLSLGSAIPSSVEDPRGFWICLFQFFYFFFGLVMPVLSLLTLALLFLCPMRARQQRAVFVFAEVCNAWNAMEVFLISVVAALLQISRFATFLVGDRCDFINQVLEKWFSNELYGEEVCFDVKASVLPCAWVLITGTILSCCVTLVLLRLAHQALEERLHNDEEEEEGDEDGDVPHNSDATPSSRMGGKRSFACYLDNALCGMVLSDMRMTFQALNVDDTLDVRTTDAE